MPGGLCRRPPHRGTNPPESARIRRYLGGPHGRRRLLAASQNCPQTATFCYAQPSGSGLAAPPLKIEVSAVRVRLSPSRRTGTVWFVPPDPTRGTNPPVSAGNFGYLGRDGDRSAARQTMRNASKLGLFVTIRTAGRSEGATAENRGVGGSSPSLATKKPCKRAYSRSRLALKFYDEAGLRLARRDPQHGLRSGRHLGIARVTDNDAFDLGLQALPRRLVG